MQSTEQGRVFERIQRSENQLKLEYHSAKFRAKTLKISPVKVQGNHVGSKFCQKVARKQYLAKT